MENQKTDEAEEEAVLPALVNGREKRDVIAGVTINNETAKVRALMRERQDRGAPRGLPF